MAESTREVWITGVGLVSSLGEGPDAHFRALDERRVVADDTMMAPYVIHRVGAINFDSQIPKKGDQRQMEAWQRIGTFAAGLALDNAGLKGNAELLGRTDLIVAAGGGERDLAVDSAILTGLPTAADPKAFLIERLLSDLRPTLFLAQLSNLLAGNISIVHGVTGSSRTFMGEEASGVDALRIGLARVAAGQSEVALVGGSSNAERQQQVMIYECGGYSLETPHRSVWDRGAAPGFALGSLGAFLLLESRAHAEGRGAQPIAKLSTVLADRADRRNAGATTVMLDGMWSQLAPHIDPEHCAIISGAPGTAPATDDERAFLARHADIPVRATGTYLGHGLEPQFPMNVALAALAVQNGRLFAGADDTGMEREARAPLRQAVVTSVGHLRGEGMALVEAVK